MARSATRRTSHEQLAARLQARSDTGVDTAEISDAVATLPQEIREAVVLRVWGELTWEESAAVAGASSSTMQRRYTAGLHSLRRIWETEPCRTNNDCPTS